MCHRIFEQMFHFVTMKKHMLKLNNLKKFSHNFLRHFENFPTTFARWQFFV